MVTISDNNLSNSTGLPQAPAMTPPGEASGAPDLLHSLTQGAHQTIDRLAEQVSPHVQRLQENMDSAGALIDERAGQVHEMTDAWMATLRTTVRDNPLAAVGAALAVGLLVARLAR